MTLEEISQFAQNIYWEIINVKKKERKTQENDKKSILLSYYYWKTTLFNISFLWMPHFYKLSTKVVMTMYKKNPSYLPTTFTKSNSNLSPLEKAKF